METKKYIFSGKEVNYYFDERLVQLSNYADPARTILIVDKIVDQHHQEKIKGWRKIVVEGAESSKSMACFQHVADELIRMEADRQTMLIGIGGGVVTDLTGFIGSVYMRGLPYAFVPTSLLAQVDAAVGGKNGVNYGAYKNMLGTIRQPDFLLFDDQLLQTLPETEWHNGFAEIIKYACICDAEMFNFLESHVEEALSHHSNVISKLVRQSAEIKSEIVKEDEFENQKRRLLNFGHTIGHAVEKLESIPHGQAVAIGMIIASKFSERLSGLSTEDRQRIVRLIKAYHLPVSFESDPEMITKRFRMDKKREKNSIHFILLQKIGQAMIKPIALTQLAELLDEVADSKK